MNKQTGNGNNTEELNTQAKTLEEVSLVEDAQTTYSTKMENAKDKLTVKDNCELSEEQALAFLKKAPNNNSEIIRTETLPTNAPVESETTPHPKPIDSGTSIEGEVGLKEKIIITMLYYGYSTTWVIADYLLVSTYEVFGVLRANSKSNDPVFIPCGPENDPESEWCMTNNKPDAVWCLEVIKCLFKHLRKSLALDWAVNRLVKRVEGAECGEKIKEAADYYKWVVQKMFYPSGQSEMKNANFDEFFRQDEIAEEERENNYSIPGYLYDCLNRINVEPQS